MNPTSAQSSELKFEIGHVLFIDIVGYSKLLINEQSEQIQNSKGDRARNGAIPSRRSRRQIVAAYRPATVERSSFATVPKRLSSARWKLVRC